MRLYEPALPGSQCLPFNNQSLEVLMEEVQWFVQSFALQLFRQLQRMG